MTLNSLIHIFKQHFSSEFQNTIYRLFSFTKMSNRHFKLTYAMLDSYSSLSKPALPTVFPNSFQSNSILPFAHAKTVDSPLSHLILTPHRKLISTSSWQSQLVRKYYWFHFENVSSIPPLLTTFMLLPCSKPLSFVPSCVKVSYLLPCVCPSLLCSDINPAQLEQADLQGVGKECHLTCTRFLFELLK